LALVLLGAVIALGAVLYPAVPRADRLTGEASAYMARAVLERWLKAQNEGDFAAYEALYATRFTDIRRSGRWC
jgi:hypothetical protein